MNIDYALWDRLEYSLGQQVPALFSALRPPATCSDIAAAEDEIGVRFPAELRAAYLRHDGTATDLVGIIPCFFAGVNGHWYSLDQVVARWNAKRAMFEEALIESPAFVAVSEVNDLKVRYDFWNPKRIPIAEMAGRTYLFVDLWPGDTGDYGQMVWDDGIGDSLEDCVLSSSFNEYLTLFANRLEQGLVAYEPGKSWVNQRGETIADWSDLSGW